MSISSEIIRRIAALKLPRAAMSEVLAILADVQAAEEKRLEDQRNRSRKSRAGNVTVTLPARDESVTVTVTDADTLSPPSSPKKVSPSKPLPKITPPTSSNPIAREIERDGWPEDFREQFWAKYPNRVAKPKALARLDNARKQGVSWQAIMAGLDRYLRSKPPDRAWLNPETFLNQERWGDQPAAVSTGPPRNGNQGFESLFQQPETPPDDQAPRSEFDLDLTANRPA